MSSTPAAEQPEQPIETVLQGWEKYAADVVDPQQPLLASLLRFTYVHSAFDMMQRIRDINAAATVHRDMARVTAEMNALVREINAFLADEANIPTDMPATEPEAPRLILPPNAGRLA